MDGIDQTGGRAERPSLRTDLSVVLCSYNGGRFIGRQFASILEQTVLPGAIHVFDDGSADATLQVVAETFAERPAAAEGVALVLHPSDGTRHGAAGNFARGLQTTSTEFVALADQDDVWRPQKLERALDVLDRDTSILLVASNAAFVDADGRALGRSTLEAQRLTNPEATALDRRRALEVLVRRNVVPGMTFTLRRELLVGLGALPDGVMHDYRLALQAAARDRLVVLTEPMVDYRIHGGNAIGLDAGNRSIGDRFRAHWRLIRTPLTDLAQWTELADSLRRDDPAHHLPLVLAKLRFERRRRFPGLRGPQRIAALVAAAASGDYRRFDVGGWRGAVKDFLRPRATDLS